MGKQIFKMLTIFAITNVFTTVQANDNIKCIVQYSYDYIEMDKKVGLHSIGYQRAFYDSVIIETWHLKQVFDTVENKGVFDFNSDTARVVRYHYNENRIYQFHHEGFVNTIFDRVKFEERKPIIYLESALKYHDSLISFNVYYPLKKTKYNGISTYKYCDLMYHYVKVDNPNVYDNDGKLDICYVLDSLANVDYSTRVEEFKKYGCAPLYFNFKYGKVYFDPQTTLAFDFRINILHESEGCKDFEYEH